MLDFEFRSDERFCISVAGFDEANLPGCVFKLWKTTLSGAVGQHLSDVKRSYRRHVDHFEI
jgi:hypothetical protein